MKKKVLIVHDEIDIVTIIKRRLEDRGFEVILADPGRSGVRQVYENQPDLVILDFMTDIHEITKRSGELSGSAILSLGFFINKDVSENVLAARSYHAPAPFVMSEWEEFIEYSLQSINDRFNYSIGYDDGTLVIDFINDTVCMQGARINLTPTEFRLLRCLVYNKGKTVSSEELLQDVWGINYKDAKNCLSLYICYLRKKIEIDPKNPKYIITDWKLGYRFGSKE